MQGSQALRNEAYIKYVGMTKGEVQHSRWTFDEAVQSKGGNLWLWRKENL